ncbi:ARM repeat-containing protein [Fomitiporia mediterranea MF3/22]|uniref:ARM repeat-containing protein n=1 Tax=Fomitiporia mediterranea (strain MF3/22) TaxID=694068 RepID=UPI0004409751|nr:ARM repeat-containing protein [Fomitiporia mediterranea MF3/22]EJD07612.1 ARM repeat-containing protein [Fomitiporia mediterranea MF3/22]
MESTERHVRAWIATGRDEEIAQLVSDISSGQTTLLNVVKALGEYLTSEEDILRTKGVDLLSQIIERCSPEKINRQATRVLTAFYAGKLEDTETTIPALKGLVPLSGFTTFSDVDAVDIAKAIFAHVDMKKLNQSTRYLVFRILDSLIAHRRSALIEMGDDFLTGYTNLVDGEKDPRNLLLAFSIDRVICIEFDISRLVEVMFNVIFCYFPITFKPPADDPYAITADDLRLVLRSCMSASPLFGQLAIPLFLDKLLGGSPATKKDIIETISICIAVYGSAAVNNFSKKLWNSLKMEVFQPVNPEIEAEALKATEVLIRTIYGFDGSSERSEDHIEGLVADICSECLGLMSEPEKSQAVPASKVIAALIGTTPSISKFVLSQVIPHLLKLFRDPDELVHRPQILTLLCVVVSAIDAKRTTLENYGLQAQLLTLKDDVLGAFVAGLKSPSSCEAALEGIRNLARMQDVLTDEELVYVVHNINELLQSEKNDSDEASDESADDALGVLISIAERNSKAIEEYTLPLLFTSLPDSPPSRDAHRERAKCWRTLRLLARLCVPAPLFETLVVRLTTKLDIICAPKAELNNEEDSELRIAYTHGILRTLSSVVELKANANHVDISKYIDRLVPRLYSLFIYLSISGGPSVSNDPHRKSLAVAGQVITTIVRTIPVERQQKLAQDLYSAYFDGSLDALCGRHHAFPVGRAFKPFESVSTVSERDTIVLLSSACVAFRKDVLFPDLDSNQILIGIQDWVLDVADNDFQRRAANHLLASILNKNAEKLSPFISRQLEDVYPKGILSIEVPAERRRKAIHSWVWIAKALVLLNSPSVTSLVNSLFNIFMDEQVGWDAARAVGEIASGGDDILTKSNHAIIKILYAQKYYKNVLPRILENIKEPEEQKANLVALSALISSLPRTVYVNDMPTLTPHLIRGLDLPDAEIRTSIISTITTVASNGAQDAVQAHARTLVLAMLKNALPQEASSSTLRLSALKCLAVLPSAVRYDVLHPLKASVLRELGKSLDDPKRAVRKEAVVARAAWFAYKG